MGADAAGCRCNEDEQLWGARGDDYAMHHLIREHVTERAEEVLYRCPATGRRWIGEFTEDDEGAPSWRLRRVPSAAELVEWLASQEDPALTLSVADPQIEVRPVGSSETLRGADALAAYVQGAETDPGRPLARAVSLIEQDPDHVVVFGSVAYPRDGSYSEHRPAAWLVTVRHGRLIRSLWFDSWKAARTAAGLGEGAAMRRLGPA